MKGGLGWRKKARQMAREALDNVFPGNDIDVNLGLEKLSIAQQQMVEIARATSDKNMKLMILDEPTSSLPMEQDRTAAGLPDEDSKRRNDLYLYFSPPE